METPLVHALALLGKAVQRNLFYDNDVEEDRDAVACTRAYSAQTKSLQALRQLRDRRVHVQDAIKKLIEARSRLAAVFEGKIGSSFRCQACHTVAVDIHLLHKCQHRVCSQCLLSTCEARLVEHVDFIAPALPQALVVPPAVITDGYLDDLKSLAVKAPQFCPFCTDDIIQAPVKAKLYSEVSTVAAACVYMDVPELVPNRADVSDYF